ncbi:MAG: ATP-binding protein [Hydrogenophaga sp.]|nr:ATP-binding protein [Hydrogenophaga sp.]
MHPHRLVAPRQFNLQSALAFATQIADLPDSAKFEIDFSNVGLVEPFPMLVVASELRRLNQRKPEPEIICVGIEHMGYAAHMGFFQCFGLDYGNAPGEARGSATYVPITVFNREVVEHEAATKGIEVGSYVEATSQRLSRILSGEGSGDLFDTLTYSIREMMRNAVEHSQADRFDICAQHWPTKKRVEVAILDRGVGLRRTLSSNPHIDASDDKKAINYALMPAISGKAFKGSKLQQKGNWANSGFGLYMTHRICRNGGNFFIASGATGMLLTKSAGKRYFDCSLDGTAVRMVIDTESLAGLRESLQRYKEEGFEFQKKYREIVDIDPSSASLMLSEDFDVTVMDRILGHFKRR